MNLIPLLLADAEADQILAAWRTDPATLEKIMIFGAIGLVTVLAVLWAIFLRKKRKRRHSHQHSHHLSSSPAEAPAPVQEERAPAPEGERRRRRRSRRRHRQRNPTLAETGGLPPLRPDSAPESEP